MSLAGQVRRAISTWRIKRLTLWEGRRMKAVQVGERTRFNVPVRCDGRGNLIIGARNVLGFQSAIRLGSGEILLQPRLETARVVIGNSNAFSNNVSLVAAGEITIGDNCQIGDQVIIYDCDFHELDPARRNASLGSIEPVRIGNNVWLGSRVVVLKGVSIGDNTVVGAMSLVTRSLPANCIAAGNPARVIRSLNSEANPPPKEVLPS